MNDLQKYFGHVKEQEAFDKIKISIASPEEIRSWSYGEVKKAETINYRTLKPEKDGLFCAKIFGPTKDYECLCGKYKRIKYRGVICEKCGVEVTLSKVRRERMGHIELACPVAHIWFLKSLPSKISTLLDIQVKKLELVLYFDNYIVIEPGLTPLKLHELLTEEEYVRYQEEFGPDSFRVAIGAEALKEMLMNLDLKAECDNLRLQLKDVKSEVTRNKIIKRLKIMEAFLESGNKPESMILDVLPVLPPDLRPLVPLDGGQFATSDLNELYRRVINRNNRLKKLIDLKAPEIIIRNEKRMLQESVDSLFDNSRKSTPLLSHMKRPLKSLSDMLKGKQGRFRQNLLGKRVDYSGRSVIVAGPNLKLHQCGLPKIMALELFKPFVYSKLEAGGYANTIKSAKKMVEKQEDVVWDILEDVIKEHPVLLNRAPTLHRLSIQAFEPILVEGKAIQLHPFVCKAFNADFDGDQMAVHVPLSLEAQLEARILMMSTNNILRPANGSPIISPLQDVVLGIYYLTTELDGQVGEGGIYSGLDEINLAIDEGKLTLNSKIKARCELDGKIYDTTAGRIIFASILPKHEKITFDMVNKQLGTKDLDKLIGLIYFHCGQEVTVNFSNALMPMGFKYATKSGVSFATSDIWIPSTKAGRVADAEKEVALFEKQYMDGLITKKERYNKVVNTWTNCSETLASEMMNTISKIGPDGKYNTMYMMAHSGARGSKTQIRQLGGMRGLMAKSSGEIIETPIKSNFKEGLTVSEFFNSTHGSRKGMSDTALKTANAGYLTRRLVDVAQDVVVREEDCGTEKGVTVRAVVKDGVVLESLAERIIGRCPNEDIVNPVTGEVIVKRGEEVLEKHLPLIESAGIESVLMRSVLTCESHDGVCAKCYGRDLSRGKMINVGEAVGIMAAQSIGEPGTQLTMRTFHIGGAAQRGTEHSSIESHFDSVVVFDHAKTLVNSSGEEIVITRNMEIVLKDSSGKEISRHKVPYGAKLFVKDGGKAAKGEKIVEWNPYIRPIITEKAGILTYVDLVDALSFSEVFNDTTGISAKTVIDWRTSYKGKNLRPQLTITDKNGEVLKLSNHMEARYLLSVGTVLVINNATEVKAGDVIAYIPLEGSKSKDITGGLPRVVDLFEARNPKNVAVIAPCDGVIDFGDDVKAKHKISIIPDDDCDPVDLYISKSAQILVQHGDIVRKGDKITDGEVSPHDILRVMGVVALARYMVDEVQDVYRMQGVQINDKHIEIIVRQMLKKKEIKNPGSTIFVEGEVVSLNEFIEENKKALASGGKPATAEPVLLGITRASLQTESFISAASFQETTRVLTEAAVAGKTDEFVALKENVIVGRLIPVGTGAYTREIKKIASERDALVEANESVVNLEDTTDLKV